MNKPQPRLQSDAGTQTDTHIKPSYIDKGNFLYTFYKTHFLFKSTNGMNGK